MGLSKISSLDLTMGKWSNIRGQFSEGEFHRGGGEFRGTILGKKWKSTKWGCKISIYIQNFIQIEQWESGQIYGENFLGGKFRVGILGKNENLQNGVAK